MAAALCPAQAEILPDALHHGVGEGWWSSRVSNSASPRPSLREADQDDDAALLHRVLGVVQGLLGRY